MKRVVALFAGVVLTAASISTVQTASQSAAAAAPDAPTFAKDVAPIVFDKCASCHREGEVAPMSLLSYEQVRPWARPSRARSCRARCRRGAPTCARRCRCATTSASRSSRSRRSSRGWMRGAPKGNVADMPPTPTFATGWTYGKEPDYILEMPVEFDIPAEGELGVQMFYSKVPFDRGSLRRSRGAAAGQRQGRAPRRHLLRRHPGRRDARRTAGSSGRTAR